MVRTLDVNDEQMMEDYRRIEQAIVYLEQHARSQPDLQDLAAHLHLSEYHLQRLFKRWVGISPKRFVQYLTKEHAKRLLERSSSVLEASLESGLSGPGRLHDLFVTYEAVTPGEYKTRGQGLTIDYSFHPSPFGECLLARTERGMCGLAFVQAGGRPAALQELRTRWRGATLEENARGAEPLIERLFDPFRQTGGDRLAVILYGTNFQLKVWEALLRIPTGSVVTYGDLALAIGMPGAARAVGQAVGRNPVPVLIPCHRVIARGTSYGGYHYGRARKRALLAWEFAQADDRTGETEA